MEFCCYCKQDITDTPKSHYGTNTYCDTKKPGTPCGKKCEEERKIKDLKLKATYVKNEKNEWELKNNRTPEEEKILVDLAISNLQEIISRCQKQIKDLEDTSKYDRQDEFLVDEFLDKYHN